MKGVLWEFFIEFPTSIFQDMETLAKNAFFQELSSKKNTHGNLKQPVKHKVQ